MNLLNRVGYLQVQAYLAHTHRAQEVGLEVQYLKVGVEGQILEEFGSCLIINRVQF